MTTATNEIPETTFGLWLLRARKERGMSQTEAGIAIGVSRALVGKWERGESQPGISHFRQAVDAYEAPWLWEVAKQASDLLSPTSACIYEMGNVPDAHLPHAA
jgi:transcriptional regulator with XRE-family HTH domain